MIEAYPYDAGTRVLLTPEVPGMDRLRWRELDMEENVLEDIARSRFDAINAGVMDARYVNLRPWPGIVANHAPVDRIANYEGFDVRLHQRNRATLFWDEVPAGQVRYTGLDRALDREQWRPAAMLTPAEMRGLEAVNPVEWNRLPYDNERGAGGMGPQMMIAWHGVQNPQFTLSLPDNNLWTPFDLTERDRYRWIGDDGREIEAVDVYGWFGDRRRLTLYLRPRRWRYVAQVLAHFLYVTPFAMFPNDEWFIKVWFDRPPYYPRRTDLPNNIGNQLIWHPWFGSYLDYDAGVDRKFQLSRAFGELQAEIVRQQYYTKLVAYILIGVEPARVAIQRTVPRISEVVCGVGVRDSASGVETRAWAVQAKSVAAVYPLQTISQFWADFYM